MIHFINTNKLFVYILVFFLFFMSNQCFTDLQTTLYSSWSWTWRPDRSQLIETSNGNNATSWCYYRNWKRKCRTRLCQNSDWWNKRMRNHNFESFEVSSLISFVFIQNFHLNDFMKKMQFFNRQTIYLENHVGSQYDEIYSFGIFKKCLKKKFFFSFK